MALRASKARTGGDLASDVSSKQTLGKADADSTSAAKGGAAMKKKKVKVYVPIPALGACLVVPQLPLAVAAGA